MTTAALEPAVANVAAPGAGGTLNALVYQGPGKRAGESKPRPTVRDPGDTILPKWKERKIMHG